jgi:hypothetical protein
VSSTPKRITIDAPSEMVIFAARHLDATEGLVQIGTVVDSAARSAITTVLRYIATAHNSPAAETSDADTLARVRDIEARLWENADAREMPVSAVCHSIALDLRAAREGAEHRPTEPHDHPGIGEIQVSRQRGRGVIVDHAPARALIGLRIIRDLAWPANIAGVGDPDLVNIADQVLYRVVGYDAGTASLIVELVEDWRPAPTVKLSEADVEEIRSRWRERYGKPGVCNHEPTGGTP